LSQLTGIDLRRAALLALKWKPPSASNRVVSDEEAAELVNAPESKWNMPWGKTRGDLRRMPAVESDPGVSEPMFLEWLQRYNLEARLAILRNGIHLKVIKDLIYTISEITATTASECRALAI
jgi:hypothetical protein